MLGVDEQVKISHSRVSLPSCRAGRQVLLFHSSRGQIFRKTQPSFLAASM